MSKKYADIKEFIAKNELEKSILETVYKEYPDAKTNGYGTFYSKTINKTYTHLEFDSYWSLSVSPYCLINVPTQNGSKEIKVYSIPHKVRIAYRTYNNGYYTIAFNKLKINMKNNAFDDNMLNECFKEINKFINKYPKLKIDTKNLEPKLKKMLAFS